MNAVEIEEAISNLVMQEFDRAEFPYQFLEAFGNKETTLKRLRKGNSNRSDVDGAVLQRSNIHILTTEAGGVEVGLKALRESQKTEHQKAKFILATDGVELQAEDLKSGEPLACSYQDLPEHFGFLLPLAGITTVAEIKNNAIDIKATGRLDKLYVALLQENPDWAQQKNREAFNHFMAQLIFCFYAEDTSIFYSGGVGMFDPDEVKKTAGLFTETVQKMSMSDGSNTDYVIGEIFRAMDIDTRIKGLRAKEGVKSWADKFPYVNGGLFGAKDGESLKVPKFSKMARTYLLRTGDLDWTAINPDIFGSMIQAVADDDERGELGMHYTSVPNILKVLNPLFLDSLNEDLEKAGSNKQQLGKLKKRIARIRVFDPACGSGNFLVIAYKKMREIEHKVNGAAEWGGMKSVIPLTNFRGIEIKSFAAEIARLALIIAEYQCDEIYIGQREALALFLPLDAQNWVTCGNALRLDWLSICPPTGETSVKLHGDDLFNTPLDQTEIDFENEGGETYICGNPPYKGNAKKTKNQKQDLKLLFDGKLKKWGLFDYVCGWFYKGLEYVNHSPALFAFVATNSVAQGQHIDNFWRPLFEQGLKFQFAVRSFKWSNLAIKDAGVTVVCIGAALEVINPFIIEDEAKIEAKNINAYLLAQDNHWVSSLSKPISNIASMSKGNYYGLSEHLIFDKCTMIEFVNAGLPKANIRKFYGAVEITNSKPRRCFWFPQTPSQEILDIGDIQKRIEKSKELRSGSKDAMSNGMFDRPHQFREMNSPNMFMLAVPVVSSENRDYLPITLLDETCVLSNKAFAIYDAPLWNMALIASRLHWVWIGTVCVRMRTDFSYSNTLGWNTFPVPKLTTKHKEDLTHAAENILLAREAHFPSTIADLYKPDAMPENLRAAHAENDRILEEIYIGRRFKNDTERLEKLFEMYTEMTTKVGQT